MFGCNNPQTAVNPSGPQKQINEKQLKFMKGKCEGKESCTAEACDSWWNTNLNCPSHEPAIMWLHYHCNGVPGRVVTNIRIWIQIFFPKIPKIIDPMKSIQSQSQNLTIFPCHILIIILQSYNLIIIVIIMVFIFPARCIIKYKGHLWQHLNNHNKCKIKNNSCQFLISTIARFI